MTDCEKLKKIWLFSAILPLFLSYLYPNFCRTFFTTFWITSIFAKDVKIIIYMLTESMDMSLRETGCYCQTVAIHVRNKELHSFTRQMKLDKPSDLTKEIAEAAIDLFEKNYDFSLAIRSMGVRVTDLVPDSISIQLDVFGNEAIRVRQARFDDAVDGLRKRFGNLAVRRAVTICDQMSCLDPKKDHINHPIGYF
ncbi:hypothetical protein [Acetobacterium tundrae]|uniref:DinB/UmuC family translesion DNA polymerase n=1 Tax=Acetobacterium tundrae TaxID=132932 RepID=UPI00242C3C9F|nr:hypothetical protein [Acetobacterium tundrae]